MYNNSYLLLLLYQKKCILQNFPKCSGQSSMKTATGASSLYSATLTWRSLNHRHIFLFDAAVIVCKRRGDNYEMKEVIDLHLFKITNNPTSDKENRKVCARVGMWFLLRHGPVELTLSLHAEMQRIYEFQITRSRKRLGGSRQPPPIDFFLLQTF